MLKILDKQDNLEEITKEGKWLIDFSAKWCGPCRMLEPNLEAIANEYNILKIDIDEFQELSAKFGIMSIPTLVVFENGIETKRELGYKSEEELKKLF